MFPSGALCVSMTLICLTSLLPVLLFLLSVLLKSNGVLSVLSMDSLCKLLVAIGANNSIAVSELTVSRFSYEHSSDGGGLEESKNGNKFIILKSEKPTQQEHTGSNRS